jgi:uroporphyrinogen-III synthase
MKRILYLGLEVPPNMQDKEVVHYPIIKIIPKKATDPAIQAAFKDFNAYTHLIFTSRSAVSTFFELAQAFAITPAQIQVKTLVIIGKRTTAKLQEYHITPHLIANDETAEGVIKILEMNDLKKSYFFLPQSSIARPIISNWLKNQQIPHVACPLYDTLANHPTPLPDLTLFREIIFTSPSTVDAFIKAYQHLPRDIKLTCIGPITEHHLASKALDSSLIGNSG